MEFIIEYQNYILFGILLNFIFTIWFGVYKSTQLKEEQMFSLMQKYEPKNDTLKIALYWFVPYYGYFQVLRDVILLQKYLKNGFSVYDYI